MHMLHLHGFQRHHSLADTDAIACLHQHGDDTAVHGGAHLAVAAIAGSCRGHSKREVARGMSHATMQEPEPVPIAQIFGTLDEGAIAEANRLSIDLLDLETILVTAIADAIAALAIMQQFQ